MKAKPILISVLVGMLSGIITVYFLPAKYELILWIILISAVGSIIQRNFTNKFFKRGFLHAAIIGLFITLTHISLVSDYLESHQEEIQLLEKIKVAGSYRLTLLAIAPIYWMVFGILAGLSSTIWANFKRRQTRK